MNISKQPSKDTFDLSWITKDTKYWIFQEKNNDSDLYVKGIVKGIMPLSINKANSRVSGITQNGTSFQVRAYQLERCRESNSLERDLIEMDIINAPQVLIQLKRRLAQHKIHTCLWNSLIIVNPFKLVPEQYSQKCLSTYFQNIFVKEEDIRKHEPHIFSFMFQILKKIDETNKAQVISISGESGSGKTETNKQALRAISYCSSRVLNMHHEKSMNMESRILKCDPILEVFGNAKTIKNDNSSRFGKLISLKINGKVMKIYHSSIKNYFLEKSRIISQSPGQRNFHIFYQFVNYLSQDLRSAYKMKSSTGHTYRIQDFHYLSQKVGFGHDKLLGVNDKLMWDELNQSLISLDFKKQIINEIWSTVAAVLLIGNLSFDSTSQGQNEPCQIRNPQIAQSIAFLLGLQKKQFHQALVIHRRTIAGELVLTTLPQQKCIEGRDSMAKAIYQNLFQWLIEQLNKKLNINNGTQQHVKHIKLLDIYGFEVFDHNSFEQLCVNYTNQKIHQIYLQQVFIQEKSILKKEGLESIISKLNFTDNIKIIELLDTLNKSVFNLLDESCSVNVRDEDFLSNIRKSHEQHDHFPPSNNVNTKKSFIIKHTPGEIEYVAQGFRQKNKDQIREDIVSKFTKSKHHIISQTFKQKMEGFKVQTNKRFLGVKIRKQVKQLVAEMSTNTDLHFIRCIKPNEHKKPFYFIDMVCYNQIKYLGILDTIQMRKESYHIRQLYSKFYVKYGILQNKISNLIAVSEGRITGQECKKLSINLMTNCLVNYNLDYQFGREKIFLKMSTQNFLDTLLKNRTKYIESAATYIKAHYRRSKMSKRKTEIIGSTKKLQRCIRRFLRIAKNLRKKKAVKVIENAWIKYHSVFFARRNRPSIMILQKYFRTKSSQMMESNKIQSVRRCKFLLRELAEGNKLKSKIQAFKNVKDMVSGDLYDTIWSRFQLYYRNNLIKYLKAQTVKRDNQKLIKTALANANYRLNMKYRKNLQKYFKGFYYTAKYKNKMNAILTIQSYARMLKLRKKYTSLRRDVIRIQRNWRNYHYLKQFTLVHTQKHFNKHDQEFSIRNQREYWNSLLFRDPHQSSKYKERGMQKILFQNEKVKQDKVGLFYYLLDFQILSPLQNVYPGFSWIQNYITLYEQSWQKGNVLQMVQVSDEHTVCATLSKLYTWGDYALKDFESSNKQVFKTIKSLTVPQGKLDKVHAHNKFTVVQIEDEQPYVIGDKHLYSEDSSSKQWKTLKESYVIINGVVLTLKRIEFSRVPLNEKIVQLSCGMDHTIAKTSLKKVYTWGNNSHGQLGVGHFKRVKKPKLLDFFKNNFAIQQVAASAYGSIALDSNGRLFWWGTNGSISYYNIPSEVLLFQKSQFIDNSQKYSVIRILPSWSKSLSLIGLTVSSHEGIFKSSQGNIKKKTFQNLMSKWNQDISTITPPYIQTISGYFQEKLMPKNKVGKDNRNRQIQNQRIRQKLLAQIMLMEEAQRTLLQEKRKY